MIKAVTMNVLMMRTLVSTALILLSACESRDDTANSESEVSPPDQALESDSSLNDPLDPVADDMGLDDQEVSRDLEVDDLDLVLVDLECEPPIFGDEQAPCAFSITGQQVGFPGGKGTNFVFALHILKEADHPA